MRDDPSLWSAFSSSTLPADEWNHHAHLRVAYLYSARFLIDEAHLRMRAGILRLNAFHGLEETPERGYHETLTRAWLALVDAARRTDAASSSTSFLEAHAGLLERRLPLRFYSRDLLMSTRARSIFVVPDLAPLPA